MLHTIIQTLFSGVSLAISFSYLLLLACSKQRERLLHSGRSKKYDDNDLSPYTAPGGFQRFLSSVGIGIAAISSFLRAVMTDSVATWIASAAWCAVCLLVLSLAFSPSFLRRFHTIPAASVCICFLLTSESSRLLELHLKNPSQILANFDTRLGLINLLFGLAVVVSLISLPRPSSTASDGIVVDDQQPLLSRFTFSGAAPLLDKARKTSRLDDADLPPLERTFTSAFLSDRFSETSRKPASLWLLLFRDHFPAFCKQIMLAMAHSILMFGPTLGLQNLLKLLEKRTLDSQLDRADVSWAWTWATFMVVGEVCIVFAEAWEEWISWAELDIPLRSQLYSLIFQKCLRFEDSRTPEDDDPDDGDSDAEEDSGADENLTIESAKFSKKNVINMLGVDVDRISNFAAENTQLLGSLFQLILGVLFLTSVLGVESVLVGLVVPLVFFPIHRYVSQKYSDGIAKMMNARDYKSHVVTEVLHAVKQIKFSANEDHWQNVIMKARQREIDAQWSLFSIAVIMTFAWESSPIFFGAASLTTYALIHGHIPASTAFTAVSLLTTLQYSISLIPVVITELIQANVSSRRVQEHLNASEKADYIQEAQCIELKDATLAWTSQAQTDEGFRLSDLNLRFPPKKLSIIVGKTGTGKSLLLAGITGEAALVAGQLFSPKLSPGSYEHGTPESGWTVPGARAVVAQIPFIESASIKENIVWGLAFDQTRYNQVVEACAFSSDLDLFEDQDNTEVGATGVNLSGGQRWRLTLARTLYSRADVLVLDDIFSAVDTHVAKHILDHALGGEICRDRTIILATHHVNLVMPKASYVVELRNGTATAHCVSAQEKTSKQAPSETMTLDLNTTTEASSFRGLPEGIGKPRKFVDREERGIGSVKLSVYFTYISACGGSFLWSFILATFMVGAAFLLYRSYIVKQWTSSDASASSAGDSANMRYLLLYVGVSILSTLMITFKTLILLVGMLKASKTLFRDMTWTILRAPLRWLERTPTGRLLNRFVGDFETIDFSMSGDLHWLLNDSFAIITVLASALFVTVWMTIPAFALAVIALLITTHYLPAAREIKRLDSVAKSPIFDLFSVTLAGLGTIRTFSRTKQYIQRMHQRIDIYATATYHLHLLNSWMTLRQGLLGAIFVASILVMILVQHTEASLAGFVLSFGLEFSELLATVIWKFSNLELDMNATERIIEYTNANRESEEGEEPAADWPSTGTVVIKGLDVAYSPELPLALRDIHLSIKSHERVGVVGRTGSGKSTLILALFRFLEHRRGCIEIDSVDTAKLSLQSLRKRLSIIPQDPVLFTGTLRSNLDPFELHTDEELKDVLRQVDLFTMEPLGEPGRQPSEDGLYSSKTGAFTSLNHQVSRGGLNISQGQRQLVCLARAMLQQPKIMLLDEATSAVDMDTDALIQKSLRERFTDSTLIVIAHRLSTIIDFDKVLVMGDGQVLEFGCPHELYQRGNHFAGMVQGSGEAAYLIEAISKKSHL